MADDTSIKVAVRCRPLNAREIARGAKPLIRIDGNQVHLDPPSADDKGASNSRATEKETKSFTFDRAFWSADKQDANYASQRIVYDYLGKDLLNHAFEGFNVCLFAYGQTGSGKSFSMMGYGEERGVIPLACEALFQRIAANTTNSLTYTVEVSFMEIYNEKVRDLLNPKNKGNLRVREHKSTGPYVEDLSRLAVPDFKSIESLMDEGNKSRTVAATNMNETSSRSHSVFTLLLTQRKKDEMTNMSGEKVSKISLVDLAGSERANSTGATGARLKEGSNINKSLTTLGKVIAALAAASSNTGKAKKEDFVPYRDSILTWLLKDSLGGNSKTSMLAALSPADFEETLSTLRYADAAKKIKTKAVVNEDPNAKLIRELKEELLTLRARIGGANAESTYDPSIPDEKQIVQYKSKSGELKTVTKAELQEQLGQSEKLLSEVNQTWEERLEQTHQIQIEREQALEELGISIEKNLVGVSTPKKMPHLVNLCEDPLMSECLIYQIKPGKTTVGNMDGQVSADIRLSGEAIKETHCYFVNEAEGSVFLHALPNAITMVNGQRLDSETPRKLKSGYRIIIGEWHVFRFNHPVEVKKHRDRFKSNSTSGIGTPERRESPLINQLFEEAADAESVTEDADWNYAQREAVIARLNGTDVDLDLLKDEDLNNLYANIEKVRGQRRTASNVGRPESRLSSVPDEDDSSSDYLASRPITWSTEGTSLDNNAGISGAALQDLDAALDRARKELEVQLTEQRLEYEEKLKTIANVTQPIRDIEQDRLTMDERLEEVQREMQNKLDLQKKQYEKKLKRADLHNNSDYGTFTDEQCALLARAVGQWRQMRLVHVAEAILSYSSTLKEANVISTELDKQIRFQFCVSHDASIVSKSSALPAHPYTNAIDRLDVEEGGASHPHLLVRVFDRSKMTINLITLKDFLAHLDGMKKLYQFVDKPTFSRHLSWEEPFRMSLPSKYSYVGSAAFQLSPVACNFAIQSYAPIICPYTSEATGRCRIRLQPKSVVAPSNPSFQVLSAKKSVSAQRLPDGASVTYIILVEEFEGLSSEHWSQIHCQVSNIAFYPASSQTISEEVTTSEELLLSTRSIDKLQIYKEVTFVMDPDIRKHLSQAYLTVEVFGIPKEEFLSYIERWDLLQSAKDKPLHVKDPLGRRPEVELVTDQQHDVLAHVYICELDPNGCYSPVPVRSSGSIDPGSFQLRHGLQRQLIIELKHFSRMAWKWLEIDQVTLSDVRLLDGKGLTHASPTRDPVSLKALDKERILLDENGFSRLFYTATWDSSAHDSNFLNRTTDVSSRVLVHLSWTVRGPSHEPLQFKCDIGLVIQARDVRPPSKVMSYFATSRTLTSHTTLFAVSLKPSSSVQAAAELWKRDTSNQYVRGEEILVNWKAPGLSLVENYRVSWKREKLRLEVEATRAIIKALPSSSLLSPTYGEENEAKLKKALNLWQKFPSIRKELKLDQSLPSTHKKSVLKPKTSKLIGISTIVPCTNVFIKKGYLALLRDPSSQQWKRQFYVLKRPYLLAYKSASETDFLEAINVRNVKVESSPEMEQLTHKKDVFAVYTAQNCYFFQAENGIVRAQWMLSLDPGLNSN